MVEKSQTDYDILKLFGNCCYCRLYVTIVYVVQSSLIPIVFSRLLTHDVYIKRITVFLCNVIKQTSVLTATVY